MHQNEILEILRIFMMKNTASFSLLFSKYQQFHPDLNELIIPVYISYSYRNIWANGEVYIFAQ